MVEVVEDVVVVVGASLVVVVVETAEVDVGTAVVGTPESDVQAESTTRKKTAAPREMSRAELTGSEYRPGATRPRHSAPGVAVHGHAAGEIYRHAAQIEHHCEFGIIVHPQNQILAASSDMEAV